MTTAGGGGGEDAPTDHGAGSIEHFGVALLAVAPPAVPHAATLVELATNPTSPRC
jgi:hypothetical protein